MEMIGLLSQFMTCLEEDIKEGRCPKTLKIKEEPVRFLFACLWNVIKQLTVQPPSDLKLTEWTTYSILATTGKGPYHFVDELRILSNDEEKIQTLLLLEYSERSLHSTFEKIFKHIGKESDPNVLTFLQALRLISDSSAEIDSDFFRIYQKSDYADHKGESNSNKAVKSEKPNSMPLTESKATDEVDKSFEKDFGFLKEYEDEKLVGPMAMTTEHPVITRSVTAKEFSIRQELKRITTEEDESINHPTPKFSMVPSNADKVSPNGNVNTTIEEVKEVQTPRPVTRQFSHDDPPYGMRHEHAMVSPHSTASLDGLDQVRNFSPTLLSKTDKKEIYQRKRNSSKLFDQLEPRWFTKRYRPVRDRLVQV
eukprot:TRINITY_DN3894_c0_g1_i6.p1 TRINITY_DN3894_c0_g1~~TRINITY_DN3894_c0_g1_i6.p1  ORF type:complete len:366 (+),score=47.26 TRINITY_DN3894_c0_g1_i6:46-1143(+)